MPKYRSHKKVWALEIKKIEQNLDKGGGAIITPSDGEYLPFNVGKDYVEKHKPKVGGYYVKYKDGYVSWSPKEAFEKGYDKIGF